MARIADARSPAEPTSEGQKDRYRRMLVAAIKLGSRQDFERVQMQDVATESEVAIATLYRYFPSKVHLFVGVMKSLLEDVDVSSYVRADDQDPADAVVELLGVLTRRLHSNRRLSMSMFQSMILAEGLASQDCADIEELFLEMLLTITGWGSAATLDQRSRAWLVIQCWFGVLMTTMSGNRPVADADADMQRACELLLAGG
ncbi:MAG: kstR 1 [Marmoricola sp.]|nr:kstR 1 [Marmoricola sp.]